MFAPLIVITMYVYAQCIVLALETDIVMIHG